jgi:hypothetical protein
MHPFGYIVTSDLSSLSVILSLGVSATYLERLVFTNWEMLVWELGEISAAFTLELECSVKHLSAVRLEYVWS